MTKFIADTDFLVGLYCTSDDRTESSNEIWREMRGCGMINGVENLYLTNLVMVEAFQLIQKKENCRKANQFKNDMMTRSHVKWVDNNMVEKAIEEKLLPFIEGGSRPSIGLTDATSLVLMDSLRLMRFLSFDEGFSKYPIYRRIFDMDSLAAIKKSFGFR